MNVMKQQNKVNMLQMHYSATARTFCSPLMNTVLFGVRGTCKLKNAIKLHPDCEAHGWQCPVLLWQEDVVAGGTGAPKHTEAVAQDISQEVKSLVANESSTRTVTPCIFSKLWRKLRNLSGHHKARTSIQSNICGKN